MTLSDVLFLYVFSYSENDLEEVLTYYTQKNKSATVFLGTKVSCVKKEKASGDPGNPGDSLCKFALLCQRYV